MKKIIFAAILLALAGSSMALAQNSTSTPPSPLSVSCAGSVLVNVVTWSAAASGGTAPYNYLWSGINVTGTTVSVNSTYNATGTYQASVRVTDSASATSSASCSAVVSVLPTNATTTPPVVPPRRHFREPILNINPAGHFLARGMTIESIDTNSFVGKVWGTTWTVNVLNGPELLFREGKSHKWFDMSQLKIGDEVGVSGFVDKDKPLTVSARVVRNYTIVTERHDERMEKKMDKMEDKMERMEDKMEKKNNHGRGKADEAAKIRARIDEIMKQIEDIKKKIGQ